MVGPPKSLYDLRKVEAAIRVTCVACGTTRLVDLEELIHQRQFAGRSCDWNIVRSDMHCLNNACDAEGVRIDGVPFAANDAVLRERRARVAVMHLALSVLSRAARRAERATVPPEAVKLALRVLHPMLGNQELLTTYWTAFASTEDVAYNGAQQAHRWIVNGLVARKWPVWAEYR